MRLAAALNALILASSLRGSDIRPKTFQFEDGVTPAIFVSADGEGCCNYTAELVGQFRLNHDATSGQVWIDNVDVVLTSATTLRHYVPVTDPSSIYYSYGRDLFEGKSILAAVPGILGNVPG